MITQLAIWAGKASGVLSRMMGNDGSTIPGVMARKFDPGFLRHLRKSTKQIIYITGTNGKTTTANLIAHILKTSGKEIIANLEGSNMVTGLSTAIVRSAPLIGWTHKDVAVMEVDEASLPIAVSECAPDYLVVTNFFRDQLDRYGEVDLLIKKMKESLKSVDVKLILNADDPFVNRFSDLHKENIFIGIDADAHQFQSYTMGESRYCPNCQQELTYTVTHYGQLGHYHCSCGFSRPEPAISAQKVEQGEDGIRLLVDGEAYPTTLKGMYNTYNALLAICVCSVMGLSPEAIKKGLLSYHSANGRMQQFAVDQHTWKLNLVKNPAGGNVTLFEYLRSEEKKQLMFCLNDNLADGEDISWIWDIDMEVANRQEVQAYIASGKRAYDAALRMKYAGVPEEKITILPDLNEAVLFAQKNKLPAYIMATYTCLSPMVSILSQKTGNLNKEEDVLNESTTIPFLPRHPKSLWGSRKYHMFKKTVRMEGNHPSDRRNQESR